MDATIDVVVVGAGQAGLATSYFLTQSDIPHTVLERGNIGESWRTQRWDSFHLNTPNWINGLFGLELDPDSPDAFSNRDQFVSYLEQYVKSYDLPVREHSPVIELEKLPGGEYAVQLENDTIHARAVVLATGSMSRPKTPNMANQLADEIISLSAGTYKSAKSLPEGAVVVVGSGQSGCQIVEDLLEAGRKVYMCVSKVARVVRFYRGRDVLAWWADMGFLEITIDQLEDLNMQFATQPQVSGTNGGHTVSLQSLARDGATLLGGVSDVDGFILRLKRNLRECIAFADEKSESFKVAIDEFIQREGIQAPVPQPDSGEPSLPDLNGSDLLETLDLQNADVVSVIWCTGFDADWSWVKLDVFDSAGHPRHKAGISSSPGLYFIGFPWLNKRKSGILYGVSEDAARIVQHIENDVLAAGTA